MHPLLFKLGPIPFHTYGFFVAIGFLSAVYVIRKLAEKSKLDVDKVMDLAFWGTLVGFVGARALFVLTRFDTFLADPLSIIKVWEGGLVFFGGPLVVVPFGIWFIKKNKLNVWKTCDVVVPGLTIGHMFGRFGCLSAGCCYGKPTEMPWGIKLYSELVERHLRGVPLHPTQLYEASALLILFVGLLYVFRKKAFDGQVFLTYFMAYPIIRSIVEIYRGDLIRGFIIENWVSTSQFISFLVFLAAAIALKYRLNQVQLVRK
jgi:phosphatidylglycerol---prolipoprotein diacylglyceryl transferase